ncbi:FliM/FliN family flagellar motor switch protein [Vibrio breoganii]
MNDLFMGDPSERTDIGQLANVPVDLTAEVGSKQMTYAAAQKLKPGEVVWLDHKQDDSVEIKVNGLLIGLGTIVEKDGKYGVKLTDVKKN